MNSFFSSFSYSFWWFLLGLVVGWFLHKLLSCWCKSKSCKTNAIKDSDKSNNINSLVDTPKQAEAKATKKPVAKAAPKPEKITASDAEVDITAAKAAGFTIKATNDLTVIEGIGPKINELFHTNGISSFAMLATQTAAQMRAVLDSGGARYRIANPSTWAQQANLAAHNRWADLKKLQNELSGGIKK